MNLLPKAFGTRPRLACEIAAGGVVAARSAEPGAALTAVAWVELAEGAIVPGLRPGNVADRVATIAAVRRALEQVGARPNARNTDVTLVIPDGAVRVLLLDFDALPSKVTEALPIVRFRLKRLVPFDTEDAMVSYQVMTSGRGAVRVLAVAMPRDVLNDYETVAREAGFEPGAVLPSTLAALAGLPESQTGALAVNIYPSAVTTAIVRDGILLLHRTVELTEGVTGPTTGFVPNAASSRETLSSFEGEDLLPLVSREESAEEWAAQEPLPEHGRSPYADGLSAEVASVDRSPYAAASVTEDLQSEIHNSFLAGSPVAAEFEPGLGREEYVRERFSSLADLAAEGAEEQTIVHTLAPDAQAEEIARAVSVAVAYFEDVLSAPPEVLLSAGPMGADWLSLTLQEQGLAQELGLRFRELVDPAALAAEATTASVPRSLLAGVVGALRS